jgi:glycerophosphoryl diester phosphodiesterase
MSTIRQMEETTYQLFTKITFRVQAKTIRGEHVHIIGDSEYLGNWIPSNAPQLSTTPLTYPLWEGTITLPRGEAFRYKYVIIDNKTQLIKWESKKKEFRTVTTTGLEMVVNDGEFGAASAADHSDPIADSEVWVDEGWLTSEYQLCVTIGFNDPAGNYQWPVVLHNVTLSSNTVLVELHDEHFTRETLEVSLPPKDVNFGDGDTIHYVYFTSYNTRHHNVHSNLAKNSPHSSSNSSFDTNHNQITKDTKGTNHNETLRLIQNEDFYFHATEFQQLKVVVDIFSHSRTELRDYELKEKSFCKIGRATIVAAQLKPNRGALTVPIFNSAHEYIGDFNFRFLVVTPFRHPNNNLSTLWSHYSLDTKPINLNIGHRGSGATARTVISENTILSFMTAAHFGADFVEFDVQLTKDKVPVLFHDIEICVRDDFNGNSIRVPIGHLTYKQFMALKCPEVEDMIASRVERSLAKAYKSHTRKKTIRRSVSLQESTSSNPEHMPSESEVRKTFALSDRFTTLAEALRKLPTELGFVVEVKYPADWAKREYNIVYHERNPLVDIILDVVFSSLENNDVARGSHSMNSSNSSNLRPFRRIVFASFDADVCYLLSRKQPLYPVFFLLGIGFDMTNDMDIDKYDIRCTDWDTAINFAKNARCRGIISYTKPILENPSLIEKIHHNKLLLFTYGRDNEDEKAREFQKKHGVDSLIVDNIIHIKRNSTKFNKLMTALAPSPLLPNTTHKPNKPKPQN